MTYEVDPSKLDTSYWRDHPKMDRPHWLWPGYHCTMDKELRRDWGITCGDYFAMYEKQDGKCALCGMESERRLDVDEDHETRKVRGLLCRKCNRNLSQRIAEYVKHPPADEFDIHVDGRRVRKREERLETKRQSGANKRRPRPKLVTTSAESTTESTDVDSFELSDDDEEKLRRALESSS